MVLCFPYANSRYQDLFSSPREVRRVPPCTQLKRDWGRGSIKHHLPPPSEMKPCPPLLGKAVFTMHPFLRKGSIYHARVSYRIFLRGGGGGGNSWLTYLASTFGRPEMSRVPFEQVLDIFKQKNRRIEL